MNQGKTWISGITLRAVGVVSIAATVALVIVLGGPGVRQGVGNRTVAVETLAAETNAPMTLLVRTIPIAAHPLAASWPLPVSAVTEAPAPAVETPAAPARAAKGPRQAEDVCQRHGGYRQNYQRGRWPALRCVFPTKPTKETRR